MNREKILVTGGAGYLGSVLVRLLLADNYRVRILDNFMFGISPIIQIKNHPNLEIKKGDIRRSKDLKTSLKNVDYLVHLAGIVGDTACNIKADVTVETNFIASIELARLSQKARTKKFIFASTCSVYGASDTLLLNEKSATKPVSLYAETKLKAEKELLKLLKNDPALTILRLGTLYGLSPRMRFDLVVNDLTKKALFEGKIKIFGGRQWRPFVHVKDIAKAVILTLQTPDKKTKREIFNVGSNKQNYQIENLGRMIKECLPKTKVGIVKEIQDKRSYRVSFEKIEKVLGFSAKKTVKDGIIEIRQVLKSGKIKDPYQPIYYNDQTSLR